MNSRKTSLWEWFCIFAVPWPIVIFKCLVKAKEMVALYVRGQPASSGADYRLAIVIALVGWLCILMLNLQRHSNGKKVTLLSWTIKMDYEPQKVTARKHRAMYPEVPDEYLSKTTKGGIVLGKQIAGTKYVMYKISAIANTLAGALFVGGPGSGKTTLMISTILEILRNDNPPISAMICDVKPEIFAKTTTPDDPFSKIVNPFDRMAYGYDLYHNISPKSSDDDIMTTLDNICSSLIDCPPDDRNKFFYESGRTIAEAVMFYKLKRDWTEGKDSTVMDGIDFLLSDDAASLVKKVLEETEDNPKYIRVRKLLKPYAGKDGEAFQGIELSIRQGLKIFTYSNIRWFFGDNPKKASPADLEYGISLYLCMPEYYLDDYYMVLKLISESVIKYCSTRPDNPQRKILLYLDEFPRLHLSATTVLQGIALGRSRGLITILAAQTMQQIMSAWKKEDAKSMSDLCQVQCYLSCSDKESADLICSQVGKYAEEHVQYSESSQSASYSRSFNDKNILEPADLMDLQEKGEAVVIIKGKYMRVNAVDARYYKIPEINKISQECLAANSPKED